MVCAVQLFICDNNLDFTKCNRKSSKSAAKIFLQLGSEIIKDCSICTQKITIRTLRVPENYNKTSSWKFTW